MSDDDQRETTANSAEARDCSLARRQDAEDASRSLAGTLLPCPFCGSIKIVVYGQPVWAKAKLCRAHCTECEVSTRNHETRDEAIRTWNTRTWQPSDAGAGDTAVPLERD